MTAHRSSAAGRSRYFWNLALHQRTNQNHNCGPRWIGH